MFTAILIIALVLVVVALVGVFCQIFNGGMMAVIHVSCNSVGTLIALVGEILLAIAKANE